MTSFLSLGRNIVAFLLLALVGCGDPSTPVDTLPRKAVNGTVTLNGQPLATGKIQFEPVQGSTGPSVVAAGEIKDGKYAIEAAAGPTPGNYKVTISSRPPVKIDTAEAPGPLPKMEPEKVPAQYNSSSTLTREVKNESVNTFDFDLK